MAYEKFLDIIKQAAKEKSDSRYRITVLTGDDQKYSSDSFGNDFDYRLNFDTGSSVTLLMRVCIEDGVFDAAKATIFFRTREQILDCECWEKECNESAWSLHKRKLSELENTADRITKDYYMMAGFGQTSVYRDKLTLANQYRALETYISIMNKWTEIGGGLLIEPAGVCIVNNEEIDSLDENDVDSKYLGVTAQESRTTEKLCRKLKLGMIEGAFQKYTLGSVWLL